MEGAIHGLLYGFSIAFEPHNLLWSAFGVVIGNAVGVLPGLGALTAIAILLPVTYVLTPVSAVVMLSGIFYGSMYGGAIGAILLNLPVHPSHAVTCLDGYPLTLKGRGGAALGVAIMASFFAASTGILVMVLFSPLLVDMAFKFGPPELCSVMMLGLVAGSTMTRGSPIKGIAMTLVGLLVGVVGTDPNTGVPRFTFGFVNLDSGVSLVALAMGVFGIAEFLVAVNHPPSVTHKIKLKITDLFPSMREVRDAFIPMIRGTLVGTAFGALPGTGPTITSFVAYALERRVSKNSARMGTGVIGAVAAPEASTHSKVQVDFVPTLSLGIPGDPVMAMILGALLVQGIQPGPQLIPTHPDIFWGLIASFWVGNLLLVVLNVPLIGLWVRLLSVPYRYLVPSALFFIAIGCYATDNDFFSVGEALMCGMLGAVFLYLDFSMAPVLLGYILGPILERNFRRALILSDGHLSVFVNHPISKWLLVLTLLVIAVQLGGYTWRAFRR